MMMNNDAIQRGGGVVPTSVRMKFWAPAEEGFREELASDTELNLQMKGSADFLVCVKLSCFYTGPRPGPDRAPTGPRPGHARAPLNRKNLKTEVSSWLSGVSVLFWNRHR